MLSGVLLHISVPKSRSDIDFFTCKWYIKKSVDTYTCRGYFVELMNYKIYSEDGTISFKKPIMVMIHGFGGGYANWVFQVRHLKKRYDLLLLELPSHGNSHLKMSEMDPDFDAVSLKIMDVLNHLGIEKATFIGLSLGTLIVKHIVFTYPEKVDRYILVGPVGKFTWLLKSVLRLAVFLLPVLPLSLTLKLVCLFLMPYKSIAYGRNLFIASTKRIERKEIVVWCKVLLSFSKTQEEYIKKMQDEPNGLYIVGSMDHFFLTMLRSDMKRIKNLAIVEKAGHICCVDKYKKVNDLIITFQETGMVESKATPVA